MSLTKPFRVKRTGTDGLNYIVKNGDKVMYMTIRELADASGVSTPRCYGSAKKMDCDGYSEFRIRFKLFLEHEEKRLCHSASAK